MQDSVLDAIGKALALLSVLPDTREVCDLREKCFAYETTAKKCALMSPNTYERETVTWMVETLGWQVERLRQEMEYRDLRPAVDAFRSGRNVMATLREVYGQTENSDAVVEVAYDLQAGTYARYAEENSTYWKSYSGQLAEILRGLTRPGDSILDVGTGEMTTLAGVAG